MYLVLGIIVLSEIILNIQGFVEGVDISYYYFSYGFGQFFQSWIIIYEEVVDILEVDGFDFDWFFVVFNLGEVIFCFEVFLSDGFFS